MSHNRLRMVCIHVLCSNCSIVIGSGVEIDYSPELPETSKWSADAVLFLPVVVFVTGTLAVSPISNRFSSDNRIRYSAGNGLGGSLRRYE